MPKETIDEHLLVYGAHRRPFYERLAVELVGSAGALTSAWWIYEDCFAVTGDGRESSFFEAWDRGASVCHSDAAMYTGEGGVIGLAAASAGWSVDLRGALPDRPRARPGGRRAEGEACTW